MTRPRVIYEAKPGSPLVNLCNSSGAMTKVLADALVPIFAGLLLGYIAGLRRIMDNQNVHNLIVFVMSFAVPCSLFLAIARTPRAALREQAGTMLVLTIAYSVLYGLSFFWALRPQSRFQTTPLTLS